MIGGIAATRAHVFDLVLSVADVPVLRWLPEQAHELPCYVIGRPDLDEDASRRSMQSISVPVYACGRTLRDDLAQSQLDDLADVLAALLWKPPQEPNASLRMTRLRATVVNVGGVDVPAYTTTVLAVTQPC